MGSLAMWVEDEPVFTRGENVLLFLNYGDSSWPLSRTPSGVSESSYYRVTANQGKYGYQDGIAQAQFGSPIPVSEIEKKIAEIYGSR